MENHIFITITSLLEYFVSSLSYIYLISLIIVIIFFLLPIFKKINAIIFFPFSIIRKFTMLYFSKKITGNNLLIHNISDKNKFLIQMKGYERSLLEYYSTSFKQTILIILSPLVIGIPFTFILSSLLLISIDNNLILTFNQKLMYYYLVLGSAANLWLEGDDYSLLFNAILRQLSLNDYALFLIMTTNLLIVGFFLNLDLLILLSIIITTFICYSVLRISYIFFRKYRKNKQVIIFNENGILEKKSFEYVTVPRKRIE